MLKEFNRVLTIQRNDDDKYYHQSTWNQIFHLLSAACFLVCYYLFFTGHIAHAGILGWLVQIPRQSGHFFFEKHEYDEIHGMSHEEKESIKPGYNLKRKKILIFSIIASMMFSFFYNRGLSTVDAIGYGCVYVTFVAWITRIVTLCIESGYIEGFAWMYKILTDPINDIRIYWNSPIKLIHGQMYETKETLENRIKNV